MTTNNTELLNTIIETLAAQIAERAAQIVVAKYPAFDIKRFEAVERAVSGLLGIKEDGEAADEPLTRSEVEHMIENAMSSHTDDYDHMEEREVERMVENEIESRISDAFSEHERETTHLSESDIEDMIEQNVSVGVAAAQKSTVTAIVTALQQFTTEA